MDRIRTENFDGVGAISANCHRVDWERRLFEAVLCVRISHNYRADVRSKSAKILYDRISARFTFV